MHRGNPSTSPGCFGVSRRVGDRKLDFGDILEGLPGIHGNNKNEAWVVWRMWLLHP